MTDQHTNLNLEYAKNYRDSRGVYMFIDGNSFTRCVRDTMSKITGVNDPVGIDFNRLAQHHEKVFYYDAVPVIASTSSESDKAKKAESEIIFEKLDSIPKYHVSVGPAIRRARRGLEQKQVDVMVAVDALSHAFRKNMIHCTLVTGDADFIPLVKALVREGVFVDIHYPVGCANIELLRSASSRCAINFERIYYLLSESYKRQRSISLPDFYRQAKEAGVKRK